MNTGISEEIREYVHEKTPAFDLDAIHRTGRRRRRVRTSAITAGVVAAAVLATGTAVSLSHQAEPQPLTGGVVQLTKGMKTFAMIPVKSNLTYALVQISPGRYAIAHSAGGDSKWQAWKLPDDAQNRSVSRFAGVHSFLLGSALSRQIEPVVLGDTTLTIGGYLTRDGGQNWTEITGGTADTDGGRLPARMIGSDIASVPAKWPLAVDNEQVLSAIDPSTGLWHWLAHQPKPGLATGTVQAGPDGTIWAGYLDPKGAVEKQSGVAVSHDRGDHWTAYTISPTEGAVTSPVGTDANHAYAPVMRFHTNSGQIDAAGILATTNGGRTWHREQVTRLPMAAVTLPDGSLLGWNPAPGPLGLAISRDGGKTATVVPGTEKAARFAKTIDGLFVYCDSQQSAASYRVSTDGLHWTPLSLPTT